MSTIRKLTVATLAGAMTTAIASLAAAHTSGPDETKKMMATKANPRGASHLARSQR